MGAFFTKIRSGFSLIFHAKSTHWPHSTRSVAQNLLIASNFLAIAQLSVCAILAHQLLPMKTTVTCWQNETPGDLDPSRFNLGSNQSDFVFFEEIKALPVTFANMDRLAKKHEVGDGDGTRGPKYFNVKKRNSTGSIVINLIVVPILLPLLITIFLACLSLRKSVSNRAGMLGAILFLLYCLFNVTFGLAMNVYALRLHKEYPTCWQSDDNRMVLEERGRHAGTILVGIEAMGLIGASGMAFLFVFAVFAAHFNWRIDAGQSMNLDDLRGEVGNRHNSTRVPSSSGGHDPEEAARPERPGKKITGDEESAEDPKNPFADPENCFQGPFGSWIYYYAGS